MKAKDVVIIIVFVALILILSWLLTCGVIWCICALLQLQFTWKVSTAIWLILGMVASALKR